MEPNVFASPGIVRREQFAELLTLRGLAGWAVEIGTHQAEFATSLLSHWPGTLVCVDPWCELPEYDNDIISGTDRQADYDLAQARLRQFNERAIVLRETSEQAAQRFADDALDFVYIDGNHKADFVRQDIELWYPKLRQTGIIAGHDFNGDWEAEVKPVVLEIVRDRLELPIFVVLGDAASWYAIKP